VFITINGHRQYPWRAADRDGDVLDILVTSRRDTKGGQPVADLVPHQRTPVVFGGLRGEMSYADDAFAERDPDIHRLFYGDDVAAP
jgi:hypothetical protein